MGRFRVVGPLDEKEVTTILRTFSSSVTVLEPKDNNIDIRLIFKCTKYGKVLLRLLPKVNSVEISISHKIKEPSEDCHIIFFSNCVLVHHGRNDLSGKLYIVFENEKSQHLEITEEGKVYFGKILNWGLFGG